MARTFQTAFCECFNCSPERYNYEALKRCLYPVASKYWKCFDLAGGRAVITANKFIQMAGQVQNREDLIDLIAEYRDEIKPRSGFLATRCKVRVSVERLVALHDEVSSKLRKGNSSRAERVPSAQVS